MLAFVQQSVTPEPRQAELVAEVQGGEGGLFRFGFADPDELQAGIIRALHDVALNQAIGTADPEELAGRASSALPAESRNMVVPATVDLVIAAGPRQQMPGVGPSSARHVSSDAEAAHACKSGPVGSGKMKTELA